MIKNVINGNIKLSTIAKICVLLTLILVIFGAGMGISRIVQARNERAQLNAINNSLEQQGVSMQTKNLILQFADKYRQTQNIVITDKDDNIVYSASKNIINGMTSFVLETEQNKLGVFNLKDSSIKFAANPRSVVPFIQKDDGTQNSDNNANIYNYNERQMPGFYYGNKQNVRGMMNGRFGDGMISRMQDRFDGQGRDGYRVTRFMGPGMMGAGQGYGEYRNNSNMLFLSSYKSDAKGLNIFYISKGFEQNNLMAVLFVTLALIKFLILILYVLLAVWVYKDSKAKGLKAVLWGLLTLFTGLIGLIIYLIVRYATSFCHACGHKVGKEDNYCIECGVALKSKCKKCGENLKLDWNYCTNCGEKQEEN